MSSKEREDEVDFHASSGKAFEMLERNRSPE
jgi:hypothetical protein